MREQYGRCTSRSKRFPGYSLGAYVGSIAKLVAEHEPDRLLDYGSGKGYQYLARRYHERWGGLLPHLLRHRGPATERQAGGPVRRRDLYRHAGAHRKPDVPAIIDELIGYVALGGFLFLGISCRPTRKKLPQGGDVHRTIEPPSWWGPDR
jgi:hypothetical protein